MKVNFGEYLKKRHNNKIKSKITEENQFLDFFREKIKRLIVIKNNTYWYIVDLMIIKHEYFLKLYPTGWDDTIKREVEMANISKNDRILHIGCGPYPISAVLINKLCGASVVTIDKSLKAVKLAKKYIGSKNIKNIEIKYVNGVDFSAKDFDVIILTHSLAPREQVLNNIFKTAKSNCRIISREVGTTKDTFFDYISTKKGQIVDKYEDKSTWNSYLFLKN